ncbi:hypothetical protein V8E55_009654 [Tylopilus felleus]
MSSVQAYSEFKPLLIGQSVGYGVVVERIEERQAWSICCGIVSAWTWSATLLQSSTAAYTFGRFLVLLGTPLLISLQASADGVCMFGMVASKVKMNANGALTFLEMVKARFGTAGHSLFTFYGFLCILIVCGNRGSTSSSSSEPSGTSPAMGSISELYDSLQQAAMDPVAGNQHGSYLTMTMKSNQGLVFGAASILSGFVGVFCDQGYWQRAFASCLGLSAWALLNTPNFPTYPAPLPPTQTSAGLAAPAAVALMGMVWRSRPLQVLNSLEYRVSYQRQREKRSQSIPLLHLLFGCLDGLLGFHSQRRKHQPEMGEISIGATESILLSSIMYNTMLGFSSRVSVSFDDSKIGDGSPDLEKQSKKDSSGDPDGPPKDKDEGTASLKRVFRKALIYSTIFTAIVIVIEYLGLCERNVIILPLWESREETSIQVMGAAYHGSVGAAAM